MGFHLCALFFIYSVFSPTMAGENERQSFIVQIRNDLKPSMFSTVDQWYRSTLDALESSTPSAVDYHNEDQSPPILHVYRKVFHGFSAKLTKAQAEEIKTRPEVLNVYPDRIRHLHTTRSPKFLGIRKSHDPKNKASGILKVSNYGSNVIIGVLDTGVWPERESFHDRGLGPVPSRWAGQCHKAHNGLNSTNSFCNRKIIGAKVFHNGYSAMKGDAKALKGATPRDTEGHGTHTASTAAGRAVKNASIFGYAIGTAVGIAPKARLAIYKICWPDGCSESDITAGFDAAVEDGVDIISLSVGSQSTAYEYKSDPIAIAAFGAIDHGIFVSNSAGNFGPKEFTVGSVAPWITTVGAGSMDRSFPADLVMGNGRVITGSSLYSGKPFPKSKLFQFVYPGKWNSSLAGPGKAMCDPDSLDPKHVRGNIVLCYRGAITHVQKGEYVRKAGGVGVVVASRDVDGEALLNEPHPFPTVLIGAKTGHVAFDYLAKSSNPTATMAFRGTHLNVKPAPVVGMFSSRGPNSISPYIMKPDLIAPGVDILAAWPDGVPPTAVASDRRRTAFNLLFGTSMSCPHVSGVAALLKVVHPDWSPSRIKSAMMTTAYVRDNAGNPFFDAYTNNVASVWSYGSGHVDPERAVDPGLVFDLEVDDYVQFLCGSGYSKKDIRAVTRRGVNCKKEVLEPWNLNYPSITVVFDRSSQKKFEVAISRTVTHVNKVASRYTVTIESPSGIAVSVRPSKLVFNRTEEKRSYVVNISADKGKVPRGEWASVFGRMTWSDGRHVVGVPIAVIWVN